MMRSLCGPGAAGISGRLWRLGPPLDGRARRSPGQMPVARYPRGLLSRIAAEPVRGRTRAVSQRQAMAAEALAIERGMATGQIAAAEGPWADRAGTVAAQGDDLARPHSAEPRLPCRPGRVGDLAGNGTVHLIADLRGAGFLDSAGVGALVGSLKALRACRAQRRLGGTVGTTRAHTPHPPRAHDPAPVLPHQLVADTSKDHGTYP